MKNMVEIRWHGRGGQGAKTACLLLADAAFASGKYVQGFPEYGPERMGAPITAYNRISDERCTIHSNIYNPDYVVFGETRSLSYEKIERAVELVFKGAKLIGTNSDITAPGERGIIPACRALISPIELATNRSAYYIGKPNPLIMRHALKTLACHHAEAAIIGDRMDTDIIAGIESELDTVLVLSGVTSIETMNKFPYRPNYILNGVGDIPKAEIEIEEK